jgi:hypothetical protein
VITQGKTEPRLAYLLRVAVAFAEKYPNGTIDYDETTCDGFCLADDLRGEVDGLIAMENELAEVTKQRDELQEWKDSAMQVESSWDAQSVGKLLGFAIGSAIHPQIEPAIREIIKQRDALAEAGNQLLDSLYSQDWRKLPAIRSMRKALAATKGGSHE